MKTIRELRIDAGMTQLELAIRVGVTPSSVYKWERANGTECNQFRDLAAALGVQMNAIDIRGLVRKKRGLNEQAALEA